MPFNPTHQTTRSIAIYNNCYKENNVLSYGTDRKGAPALLLAGRGRPRRRVHLRHEPMTMPRPRTPSQRTREAFCLCAAAAALAVAPRPPSPSPPAACAFVHAGMCARHACGCTFVLGSLLLFKVLDAD